MTDQPNKHDGETTVDLVLPGGKSKTFRLRPNFQAVAEIEEQTGQSVLDLCAKATPQYRLGHVETATILAACMRAAGDKAANRLGVGDMLMETGIGPAVSPVIELLSNCITGGRKADPKGEAEAASES